MKQLYLVAFLFIFVNHLFSQKSIRTEILLNDHWKTAANDSDLNAFRGFETETYDDKLWKTVDVPHNWDAYEGYRRLKHGNRHGYAWYRKSFQIPAKLKGKQIFLWFEGVGSYATVWVNGKKVGYHAGGRTSFTLDITNVVDFANPNMLAVRADHPAFIKDLPWVCGGCSDEYGFSEGSQPMGIFRSVHLIATNSLRIQPFGVHVWNDTTVSEKSACHLFVETELKNYSSNTRNITVVNQLVSKDGKVEGEVKVSRVMLPSAMENLVFNPLEIDHAHLWSLSDPYLYSLETSIMEDGKCVDKVTTPYGVRWISWPINRKDSTGRFLLNGKPVFINGVAEYEHQMGQSHAFSDEQIHTRVMQVKAAGFNAFRDAHQPHNLRYQHYWDQSGLLWWPQMAAHIWYDTPEFRENFKNLLTDWIKERRNSPSVILWGLENESVLPEFFAKECSDLIRKLDPTASSQRKITTCNGGTGTDWNVVQNWSGTYGSNNPLMYGQELEKQLLNGEYGAWRSIDLHTEGPFVQNGPISEDRFTQLMESKVRLAEGVKDQICGQFLWLLSSHENPGRIQNGEGLRDIDRVGPVNYKGIFTPWGEPLDAFYMFRSNYVCKDKEPMVYIVSHTWPDRWKTPGVKDSILIYSNCDSVELFNDVEASSLGFQKKNGIGTHFQWDQVNIRYNVLYAKGYVKGKPSAADCIVLHHLPEAPHANASLKNDPLTSKQGYHYLYRVNCGGPDYRDHLGNLWLADRQKTSENIWGSRSWTDDFTGMPAFFGSQRRTFDRITGTSDWKLFQSFRYGRDKLQYEFDVPNGDYQVELYFTEPWYGIGGGMDYAGWRLFDVAVNGRTMIQNLDIGKESRTCKVLRKIIKAKADHGKLMITFPRVVSGEAVISAIAISSKNKVHMPEDSANPVISQFTQRSLKDTSSIQSWLDTGDECYSDDSITFYTIPSNLYGATWIQSTRFVPLGEKPLYSFRVTKTSDVYLALDSRIREIPAWMNGFTKVDGVLETDAKEGSFYKLYSRRFEDGSLVKFGDNGNISGGRANMYIAAILPVTNMPQTGDLRPVKRYEAEYSNHIERLIVDTVYGKKGVFLRGESKDTLEWSVSVGIADTYALKFRYVNKSKKSISGKMRILSADGRVVCSGELNFPASPEKWRSLNSETESNINAGNYTIQLWVEGEESLPIDFLEVQ